MQTIERAVTQMLEYMRENAPLLKSRKGDLRRQYFILYYERLLELIDGAMRLIGQTRDWAPANVLLRSALECSVDLKNLAEKPGYEQLVRAMVLENRSALYHYKSQPAYDELVEIYGQDEVIRRGEEAEKAFRDALKTATQHFPLLHNASRNLNVLNRFRIAGQEERYQTEYTLLSMATHNDMTMMELQGELIDSVPEDAQMDVWADERAWNMCLRFLVDALKYKTMLMGRDDELVQACIGCLETVRRKQERKAQKGKYAAEGQGHK